MIPDTKILPPPATSPSYTPLEATMKLLLLALAAAVACAQPPAIDDIMRRVALNQAKSQDLRTSYLYHQKQVLKAVRGNGKIAREEHREYDIAPKPRGNASSSLTRSPAISTKAPISTASSSTPSPRT